MDPSMDYDRHGLLVHRRPTGEVELVLPHSLRSNGPYAIVQPLAEDGSDLSGGYQFRFRSISNMLPETGFLCNRLPPLLKNPEYSGILAHPAMLYGLTQPFQGSLWQQNSPLTLSLWCRQVRRKTKAL